jgi:DNA polymerase III epsilon subunit-like protein
MGDHQSAARSGCSPVAETDAVVTGAPASPSPSGLDGVRFAVIDIETSGLRPDRHRILQLAVVTVDARGQVLDRWSSYVRPRWLAVSRLGPRRLHGITKRQLRDAPNARTALQRALERVDGAVLTAHNLAFDMAFVRRAARRAGLAIPSGRQLCTLTVSRSLDPEGTLTHRLADLCKRYGVSLDRPHDALADAQATAQVLPFLLAAAGITTGEAIDALPSRPERRHRDGGHAGV